MKTKMARSIAKSVDQNYDRDVHASMRKDFVEINSSYCGSIVAGGLLDTA